MQSVNIRPLTYHDLSWFHEIRNDPETYKWLHIQRAVPWPETIEWYKEEKPLFYVAMDGDTQEPFGYFRTHHVDSSKGSIEIGMDIDPSKRGQGRARPAYEEFLKFLRSRLYTKFTLEVLSNNKRAIQLYEKLGFVSVDTNPHPIPADPDCQSVSMIMSSELRGVKVIPVYFGDRRKWPPGERDSRHVYALLEYVLEMEHTNDPGIPCDVIFVINETGEEDKVSNPEWERKCYELLESQDGKELKNGRGVIEVRRRHNVGVSFASYDEVFNDRKKDYDVWFFCEDDQVIVEDNIFYDALLQFRDLRDTVGFVGVVGLAGKPFPHFHGGCGMVTTSIAEEAVEHTVSAPFVSRMLRLIRMYGRKGRADDFDKGVSNNFERAREFLGRNFLPWYLPHGNRTGLAEGSGFCKEVEVLGEVAFSYVYSHMGYKLKVHPRKKYLINWKNAHHKGERKHFLPATGRDGNIIEYALRNCHGEAQKHVPYEVWMDSAMEGNT